MNRDATSSLHLRGGSLADSYGYNTSFTRRTLLDQPHDRAGSGSRRRPRTRQGNGDTYPSGGDHSAMPKVSLYGKPARALGVKDSPIRPAPDAPSPGRAWLSWGIARSCRWGRARRELGELTSSSWRPTRMAFDVHWPKDELGSGWFEKVYTRLYVRVRQFVTEYFGYGDVPVTGTADDAPEKGFIWLEARFSEQLMWFVEEVAMQDNNAVGGWDDLLVKRLLRECLVTGVIGKVLETSVFDDLLFGADKTQKDMLEAQDKCTLELEGYQRTQLRSHCVRTMLRDDALTPEFWPCVDQLAMQLMVLLLPLIRLMDKYFPASQAKPMRDIYQALHAIVAEAAYLSIGIRWSRNIFRFSLPYPGEPWDMDQEQVDNAVYNASEAARDKADKIDEELWKAKREPPRQPGAVAGSNIPIIGGRAGMMIAAVRNRLEAVMRRVMGQGHEEGVDDEEDAAHFRPSSRLAKVQIILWPMLQRFAAVGEIDPKTGAANGENVTTIFKSQVVYYCGWADESGGSQSEHYPTLADWVHESKRERMWKSLMRLRWIAYAAAVWLLLGFLSRYISVVDDILQIVRHGLVGLAKYVAREALLFVMEVLITVIAIAIGIAKIVMFLAYAVRNTLGHLLALAARLLWGAVGSIGGAAETAGVDRAAGWYDPAFSLPELSWQSMRGMAKAVAGEVVWKTVTVQVPAGYTRTG